MEHLLSAISHKVDGLADDLLLYWILSDVPILLKNRNVIVDKVI